MTQAVTVVLQTQLNTDGTITVAGQIPILFADYGISKPEVAGFVTTEDNGVIELRLELVRPDAPLLPPEDGPVEPLRSAHGEGRAQQALRWSGTKAVIAALFANGGIAIAKFVGLPPHRLGVDAGRGRALGRRHGNQAPPAARRPPGRSARRRRSTRSATAASATSGRSSWPLVLFTLGGMFAIYEGVEKIRHPHELESPEVAIGILLFAHRARVVLVPHRHQRGEPREGRRRWWQFIRRSKMPELPVVLLEDLGALVGLVLALAAVRLPIVTDDACGTATARCRSASCSLVIAIVLAIEMKSLLIGESADRQTSRRSAPPSRSTRGQPADPPAHPAHRARRAAGRLKVAVQRRLSMSRMSPSVNRVEATCGGRVPTAPMIYIEPDVFRTGSIGRSDPDPARALRIERQ